MTMTSHSSVFLDTNILVYAALVGSPFHAQATRAIRVREQAKTQLWVSRQVLREYLAAVTRAPIFPKVLTFNTIILQVQRFGNRFQIAEDNADVTAHLLQLLTQIPTGGRQVHDANIVATMLAYGVDQILTHNVSDFKRFSSLITVLPLGAE